MVNELVREYNDLAMFTKEYQEHGGAKDANTPYVDYNYDESATGGEFTKGLRLTSLRYPDGRLVHHTYGTSGSDADNLNRLDAIQDDSSGSPGATLAQYTYLGLDQVAVQDLPEPDIKLDLFGGTSGTYAGLDRFDRVIDHRWYDYGSSTDVDRIKYGYDRASNRVWRENTVSKNQSTPVYLDEFYTYDGLHRLETTDRGELNATKTGITGTPAREEDWTLDPLGNWSGYVQRTSGTTDLDQSRSVNPVNEITDITETTGTSWITPSYDKRGNMVVVPRPDDPANGYTCTYDAWNRLVKVEAGISVVATYAYDGLHRRVTKTVDSTVRHFYYTSSWQAIEERVDSSTSPDRQFLWGPRYIDHLILRDRDTDANGTLDERLYTLQDDNWNVTTLTDSNGDPVERYIYDAYGTPAVLTGTFGSRTASDYDWEYHFTGRRWDSETGLYYYRNRLYAAQMGRFLTRDPAVYVDGYSLYRAAFVPNKTDPSGKLRFSKGKPWFRDCGGLRHAVNWLLDRGEDHGIILQAVCYLGAVFACRGKEKPRCIQDKTDCTNQRTCSSLCYLEFWRVGQFRAGVITELPGREGRQDTFSFPICTNTWGFHAKTGTGLFIPWDWIERNGYVDVLRNDFHSGTKGVASACNLYSACFEDQRPRELWSKAVAEFGGKATTRASFTAWNCCCGRKKNEIEWSSATPH